MLDISNKALVHIECYDQIPGNEFDGVIDKIQLHETHKDYYVYTAVLIRCHARHAYVIEYKHLPNTLFVFTQPDNKDLLRSHISQVLWEDDQDTIDNRSEPTGILDGLATTKRIVDLGHIDFICQGYYISGEYGRKNSLGDVETFITVYASKEHENWIIQIQNYIPGKELNLITHSERDFAKILNHFSYTLFHI